MDHSENDKRFYVYVHKDANGVVKYVGQGTRERITSKSSRTPEHLDIWDSLTKVKLQSGLSKAEAFKLEAELMSVYADTIINKKKSVPPATIRYEEVSKYVYYDDTSSTFLRRKTDRVFRDGSIAVPANSECGSKAIRGGKGYSSVFINGRIYRVHRVIYSLHTKSDLDSNMVIDHIDGDRANNSINNLRLVTPSDNSKNKKTNRKSEDGLGVVWKNNGRSNWYWVVQWRDNFKVAAKYFNPITLFPDLPFEEAKQKAFELAVAYRKQKEIELY